MKIVQFYRLQGVKGTPTLPPPPHIAYQNEIVLKHPPIKKCSCGIFTYAS